MLCSIFAKTLQILQKKSYESGSSTLRHVVGAWVLGVLTPMLSGRCRKKGPHIMTRTLCHKKVRRRTAPNSIISTIFDLRVFSSETSPPSSPYTKSFFEDTWRTAFWSAC